MCIGGRGIGNWNHVFLPSLNIGMSGMSCRFSLYIINRGCVAMSTSHLRYSNSSQYRNFYINPLHLSISRVVRMHSMCNSSVQLFSCFHLKSSKKILETPHPPHQKWWWRNRIITKMNLSFDLLRSVYVFVFTEFTWKKNPRSPIPRNWQTCANGHIIFGKSFYYLTLQWDIFWCSPSPVFQNI